MLQMGGECLREGIKVDKQPTNRHPKAHHIASNTLSWKADLSETIHLQSGQLQGPRQKHVRLSHSKNIARHIVRAGKLRRQYRCVRGWIDDYLCRKFDICSRKTNSKHDNRSLANGMALDEVMGKWPPNKQMHIMTYQLLLSSNSEHSRPSPSQH